MKDILIVATNKSVMSSIIELLKLRDFNIHQLDEVSGNLSDYQGVIIIEPFEINQEYLSIWRVWKRYLEVKAQHTKLLILGFQKIEHPNYLNLLEVTERTKWRTYLSKTISVTEDWKEERTLISGIDILDKISVFFKGHHRQGIIDCMTYVRATLDNANSSFYGSRILKKEKRDFLVIWKEVLLPGRAKWREFYSRFKHYYPYLEAMPFSYEFKESRAVSFIGELNDLFSGRTKLSTKDITKKNQQFETLNAFHRFGLLVNAFLRINQQYIDPEYQLQILMIDDDEIFFQQVKQNFTQFSMHHALNEAEAIEKLNDEVLKLDLILLDLQLEDNSRHQLGGVDLIPKIKKDFPKLPLVIVSTHNRKKIIRKTLALGADHFLNKSTFDVRLWSDTLLRVKGGIRLSEEDIIKESIQEESAKPKILLIEDELTWQNRIKGLTNRYSFDKALTIKQAKDKLNDVSNKYDMILLDLYFQDGDGDQKSQGFSLIKKIKYDQPNLPILVITNSPKKEDEQKAFRLGAKFYWVKSHFNADQWLKSIDLMIELKILQDQLEK